jgi:hypothetical protein
MKYPKIKIVKPEAKPDADTLVLRESDIIDMDTKGWTDKNLERMGSIMIITRRNGGSLAGKGIYLDGAYDWHIVQDEMGYAVLIATYKTYKSAVA